MDRECYCYCYSSTFGLLCALSIFFPPLKRIVERTVEKKIGGTTTIDAVHFSWYGPQRLQGVHITTPQIDGVIKEISSTVPFWSINSFTTGIELVNGSGTTHVDGQNGQFSFEATKLNPDEITLHFTTSNMPTATTLQFLNADSSLLSLIGPSFNATGSASMQNDAGSLNLDLASATTKASIKASFTPEEITLQEPLTLACYLTPEFTQKLTQGALLIQSKNPARLRVESEGFSCSRPFSLDKLRIAKANVDFGRVTLEHANLTTLATLLKSDSLTANQIDTWLTDVDWSLQEGRFEMGRIDALLEDSIHLCAWGKANLVRDQLNMIFGIPSDTLTKALRIKNLTSTYVLQIPVSGSLRNPNFDAGSATAKIALLYAGNQVQKQGGVLGGVATAIGRASEEKAPVPKRPFPWE